MEKQFINESLFLEKIANIENLSLDEELNTHTNICDNSGVEFCVCKQNKNLCISEPF